MLVSDVKDLVKSLNIDGIKKYYCGVSDNKQEYSLGFYKEDSGRKEVDFQGNKLSITSKQIQILISWNKIYDETEKAAYQIYKKLEELSEKIIEDKGIIFNDNKILSLEMIDSEPLDYKKDPVTNSGIFQQGIRIRLICVE